ncbi:uncharacterized protein LOC105829526 [Monomorium pharaonis]|uniref:uncharacterized protein LOC105829526 n=1 Tax=Monomorium pharaonis TaxID=307658 RepID=UPI00063FC0CD|nr:uncharacterized protein LOC105829526 [Monomorium pharaonis]XP_012523907.1 uncharacterized protein LOC105829526 [Monomorium pharaonis]
MDNPPELTSTKKKCMLTTNKDRVRPVECTQKFPLSRQYLNTMKQALKRSISVVDPTASSLTSSSDVMVLSEVKSRVPYNLQKLRILSPRGRDLGEFNVEMQSTNSSKENTITIIKSNSKSNVDSKSLKLSLSPVSTRMLPRILKQSTGKIAKRNLTEMIEGACSGSVSWTSNTSTTSCQQQSMTTVPINIILTNGQSLEGKKEKQTCNSINAARVPSTSGINSKYSSVCQTVDSNRQKYIIQNGADDTDRYRTKVQEIADKINSEIASTTKVSLSKNSIGSPCPANCKRPTVNFRDNSNIGLTRTSFKLSKGKCIATIKNTENGKIVTSLKSVSNLMPRSNQYGLHNNSKKNSDNGISYNGDDLLDIKPDVEPVPNSQVPEIKTRNVMTIVPSNKILSFGQNAILVQGCNAPMESASKNVASIGHIAVRSNNAQSKDSKKAEFQNNHLMVVNDSTMRRVPQSHRLTGIIDDTNAQLNVQQSKDPPSQKNLSSRLSIIRKAMDSVKDNTLREQALKALADCGVGIERYVPIRPKDHKAMHDTQVQTVVFGLLDPKTFVLINKDLDNIHRLNQITLHDIPDDQNLLQDNSHSNNLVSKDPDVVDQSIPFDLDNFMEEFLKEESNTLKMKETLSSTRVRCNSLLESLQKDFESVKRFDQNGRLNIHNAVISDNVNLVQRQLIVLKHSKQSVDILTEDGMTSLELAIKYDACSKVVKLLLDAGAQPVIPRSIHESAVIIASKQSSPLLPMLISRVSDAKLLNQVDSEGLAAIHYCSIYGNLEGVKALLSVGATVDLKDRRSGRTALFHAIDNGQKLVMQTLLKAGAVASIANYAGQTPLNILNESKLSLRMEKDKT